MSVNLGGFYFVCLVVKTGNTSLIRKYVNSICSETYFICCCFVENKKWNIPVFLKPKNFVETKLRLIFAPEIKRKRSYFLIIYCESSSVGRARPCQGRGRGFESRLSLKKTSQIYLGRFLFFRSFLKRIEENRG